MRFPDPEQSPRTDECAKVGSAANDDAWVAIYCGHEIQLYDNPGGAEARKTGSVYTFDNNDIDDIGVPKERGEWEDYEIKVVGQKYTISRNGKVINEFENTPGKNSDRAGDPSTTLRQFVEGYIGLQNHGGADTCSTATSASRISRPGAAKPVDAKPFTVTGKGPHTIEVRSTDAAGNAEASEPFDLRDRGPDAAGPATTTPQPQPLVPQVVSPIIPPMVAVAGDRVGFGTVSSKISRATFAKTRRGGADRLHGCDGRHGEADGHLQGGQAAQAGQDDAGATDATAGARTRSRWRSSRPRRWRRRSPARAARRA